MSKTELRKSARELSDLVRPDLYFVITLKQAVRSDRGHWTTGGAIEYELAWNAFMKAFSKRLYGKRRYKRKGLIIPNVSTLENCYGKGRWHINACFRRPPHVTVEQFERIFIEVWRCNKWYAPDIRCQEITGDAVGYALKEGLETLLAQTLSF